MQEKPQLQKSQIVIYRTKNGETKIDVRFDGDTVWLTQSALAELFQTTKQNISLHIQNIFEEVELKQNSTVKHFLTVQNEGERRIVHELEYYNLCPKIQYVRNSEVLGQMVKKQYVENA